MKKVIKGFVTYSKEQWDELPVIGFSTYDPRKLTGFVGPVVIKEHEFEVEIPDDFDPRPLQVRALEAERQKLRADFAARCTEIERQISELTCLEADFAAHRESLEVMA